MSSISDAPRLHAPLSVAAVLCVIAGGLLFIEEKSADPRELPDEAVLVGEEL